MTKHIILIISFLSSVSINLYSQNFRLHENGVTVICDDAQFGESGEINGITFTKRRRSQITNENASTTCTSGITDMRFLFIGSAQSPNEFNADISHWDVSNVTDMSSMFKYASTFNQDITHWNVSNVKEIRQIFRGASSFNQDISSWNVGEVRDMYYMFKAASSFNQDISNWDVSSVVNMEGMFEDASSFNQNLKEWCVSKIRRMPRDFAENSALNESNFPIWGTCPTVNPNFKLSDNGVTVICDEAEIGETGTINDVTYTKRSRNQINSTNASTTCTSGITDMSGLFGNIPGFNKDISHWDVSDVSDMRNMFNCYPRRSFFNKDISYWDVSNVTKMQGMFSNADFNQDIGDWNVSNVTKMQGMFYNADFNQDIGDWNVSNVTNMSDMFWLAKNFNQDIGDWDVSSVSDMETMFSGASNFNQDLSDWCVSLIGLEPLSFASNSALIEEFYPIWGHCPTNQPNNNSNFYLHENGVTIVCDSAAIGETGTVNRLTYTKRTREQINSNNATSTCTSGINDLSRFFAQNILINTYNGDISHWDVSSVVNMQGMFEIATLFNQDISHWDVSSVINMQGMFRNAHSFNQDIGNWDVSNVIDMSSMFFNAPSFNQDIGSWDVSNVTDMSSMFSSTFWERRSIFNQDIGNWDVSNVTNMEYMFSDAYEFNQDIGNWEVSNVTNMQYMFNNAHEFNQNIGSWNVSKVTNMDAMLNRTYSFNQDISKWCVSNIPSKPFGFSTNSGIQSFYLPLWGTCPSSTSVENQKPFDFKLYQNYPNPFNPSTEIKYSLSKSGNVRLDIYNVNGERINTIVDKWQNSGQYSIVFNAYNTPSGVYLYRLITDDKILTRKMLLIK